MRMVVVCAAIQESRTSGADAWEKDSRKWCSTEKTVVKPTDSASLICSIISRKCRDSSAREIPLGICHS